METAGTADFVQASLEKMGIRCFRPIPNSVCGILEGDGEKTVALRADMDALPIEEQTGLDFSSAVPGRMHACGHDAHTAIALGSALLLSRHRELVTGNVKFIFQPAEETSGGALPMIRAGVLRNPEVSAIFGLHCNTGRKAGEIALTYGQAYAASETFDIEIIGKMSHGAAPQGGIDAVLVAAQVITALHHIVSREIDPVHPAVLTLGTIAGGQARNILAERVRLEGICRATDPEVLHRLRQKVIRTAEGVASGLGAKALVSFEAGYTALINNDAMTDLVRRSAEKLLGRHAVHINKEPNMGVEDMAYFLKEIPGCFFFLGVANEEKGITAQLHNGAFTIDEEALIIGTAIQCENIVSFLSNRTL